MKKAFISILAALLTATGLFAQTPEEVIARMDQETARFETEGFSMVMDMKIPILGSFPTQMYTLGKKYKAIIEVKGKKAITWSDGVTDWDYDVSKNELTITNATSSDAEDSVESLNGITEGYDVKLKKETAEAWYFLCTKSKTNTNKDDPKKMDLVVSKATYLPISHSVTMKGVTVTLRDFTLGVTEEEVTFDPSQYADAKIIDKR
jgi:outer membrane lipoprotein-sorting protein